ncbi:MAG TPA: YajG family lipoprotein [Burkholderiales bacterium]|nr:YajG family lipoprotein [Burkholderiales bacterium]
MKITSWLCISIGILAMIQGCALQPQNVRIDPRFDLGREQTGDARTIGVAVSDARPTSKLGEVGDPNREMVDVSVSQDPSPAIYSRVSDALSGIGYKVAPYAEGVEPSLKIEIASLKLESDKRAFDFLTTLHAEVAAQVENGRSHFERRYTINQSMNSAGPIYINDSTRLVNDAVSAALKDMLSDQQLLAALNK